VILDGAHNADKIAVAIDAALARSTPGRKVAVVGLLAAKATPEIFRPLAGRFDTVWVTEPRVYGKRPLAFAEAKALFASIGVAATAAPDRDEALAAAIERAGPDGTVVVVGSFYLAGDLRERWHPKREVVLRRSSWPDQAPLV
jgi:dihydrofolate synthase/folylpolyglutamate synthase